MRATSAKAVAPATCPQVVVREYEVLIKGHVPGDTAFRASCAATCAFATTITAAMPSLSLSTFLTISMRRPSLPYPGACRRTRRRLAGGHRHPDGGHGVAALFVNRNLIVEQKTSANQYRSTLAMEAAEAGLEWATAMLNKPEKMRHQLPEQHAAGDVRFRQKYLTPIQTPVYHAERRQPYTRLHREPDWHGWACSCPAAGTAHKPGRDRPGQRLPAQLRGAPSKRARPRAPSAASPWMHEPDHRRHLHRRRGGRRERHVAGRALRAGHAAGRAVDGAWQGRHRQRGARRHQWRPDDQRRHHQCRHGHQRGECRASRRYPAHLPPAPWSATIHRCATPPKTRCFDLLRHEQGRLQEPAVGHRVTLPMHRDHGGATCLRPARVSSGWTATW